jgi:hypothetical protein
VIADGDALELERASLCIVFAGSVMHANQGKVGGASADVAH